MADELISVLSAMHKEAKDAWRLLEVHKASIEGALTNVYTPQDADGEFRDLLNKAKTPWLSFAAEAFADSLIVDGYSNDQAWTQGWERNGFSGEQHAVNYEACAYGHTFILVFPDNQGGVLMKHLPTLKTYAVKADEWDAHPTAVLTKLSDKHWRYFDETSMVEVIGDLDRPTQLIETPHSLGVCPVVMVTAQPDGSSVVEKGKNAYKRVVDNAFTALTLLRYQSFPQKWMTGGEVAVDEAGNPLMNVSADSLLHSEDPESRFGNFGHADLNQTIASTDAALGQLASVLSIPSHYFHSTELVNVSSDTIAATETSFQRKLNKLRETIGEGYETALRYVSYFMGDYAAYTDYTSEVSWRSTEVKSLAASADAVFKLASIGAPAETVLKLVPGLTQADIRSLAQGINASQTTPEVTPTQQPIPPVPLSELDQLKN